MSCDIRCIAGLINLLTVFLLLLQFPTLPRMTFNKTLRPEMTSYVCNLNVGETNTKSRIEWSVFPL